MLGKSTSYAWCSVRLVPISGVDSWCGATALSKTRLRTPGVSPGVKAASRRLVEIVVRRFCSLWGMEIRCSAHGAYPQQYHVVGIPK